MKIVDEKGKLFGFINIIDLCILIVIVLIVGFVGYKYIGKGASVNNSVQKIFVDLKCPARSEAVAGALHKKDQIVSLTSFSGAVVESFYQKPAVVITSDADGNIRYVTDEKRKDVYVTISMTADLKAAVIKLGSQEIAIGKTIILKTNRAEFGSAVIENIRLK
ncbi:MAG: DUF4330 domain-containing protein [Clostridia bacterium]|jgi:hypothetical protein